jgi:hypothetical protein
MHAREMRLSHVVHYPHVSTTVAVIIRVIYKIFKESKHTVRMLK